ncbi:PIN domain nuclease [Streptomyces bambusae]|uniref:Ribonuclease VapC n=1 Tax=Streptomyces bambusae TaxID=1550616 RepID=A0ABS6Z3Z5_9ACTN|nr:PIN domain nuclease [Streptomyces bambusae]MBW5481491.1 PIN domain-containing protein [Streptomyces bambusae]
MSPVTYLVDTSAAVRIMTDKLVRTRWSDHLVEGVVALCDITELEILFSARSLGDRLEKQETLAELFNWTPIHDSVFRRAQKVQRLLTDRGEHRSAGPVDLLVAATAELSGLTVLHYDSDFETVARVTGQATAWVAPPGSL